MSDNQNVLHLRRSAMFDLLKQSNRENFNKSFARISINKIPTKFADELTLNRIFFIANVIAGEHLFSDSPNLIYQFVISLESNKLT